ncbi:GldG family protein [Chloroflexi bacterium]|nr:GldG family protein [Chloroflexota bacterium]
MPPQPQFEDDSYKEIIITSIKSPNFWSTILGAGGIFAVILGGSINLAFDGLKDLSLWVLMGGAGLVFLALVLSPRTVAIFLAGRKGRYGANVAVMTLAFFIIILIANFLMYQNPNRIDVTATRVFTLSEQTYRILDNLSESDRSVHAYAFFVSSPSSNNQRQSAEDLLNEFDRRSDNFTFSFVDPELNRSEALKYKVTTYPSIVFEADDGKFEGVTLLTEQDFVTGILIATGTEQKVIYYLTGHGETSISRDPMTGAIGLEGLDLAIDGMQRDNYFVMSFNLKQFERIPDDAAVLIIPGPKNNKDLDEAEYEAILDYIQRGGRILMLLDPDPPVKFNTLAALYGMAISSEHVVDAVSNVSGEYLTPMTQKANGQFTTSSSIPGLTIADDISVTLFPDAAAILTPAPEEFALREHINLTQLSMTTPASWLTEDPEDIGYSSEKQSGPFPLAAVVEATGKYTDLSATHKLAKIVLFSDSDFATNKYFASMDNADIFLNSVNWLADDFELISIRPKLLPYRELVVNSRERDFIKWSSWTLPPTFMLFMAFIVWWRRR